MPSLKGLVCQPVDNGEPQQGLGRGVRITRFRQIASAREGKIRGREGCWKEAL